MPTEGRMTPETRLDIPVEVIVDGTPHEGFLEHWRKRGDRWQGYVRYSSGVGALHINWFDQDLIRKTGES